MTKRRVPPCLRLRTSLAWGLFALVLALIAPVYTTTAAQTEAGTPIVDPATPTPTPAIESSADPTVAQGGVIFNFCKSFGVTPGSHWGALTVNADTNWSLPPQGGAGGGTQSCVVDRIPGTNQGETVTITIYNADTDAVFQQQVVPVYAASWYFEFPEGRYYAHEDYNDTTTPVFEVKYLFRDFETNPESGLDPDSPEYRAIFQYVVYLTIYSDEEPDPDAAEPIDFDGSGKGRVLWNWQLCFSTKPESSEFVEWYVDYVRTPQAQPSVSAAAVGQDEIANCETASPYRPLGNYGSLYFDQLDDQGNVIATYGPLTNVNGLSGGWTWEEYEDGPLPLGTYQARFVWDSGTEAVSSPFPVDGWEMGTGQGWPTNIIFRIYQAAPITVAPASPTVIESTCVDGSITDPSVTAPADTESIDYAEVSAVTSDDGSTTFSYSATTVGEAFTFAGAALPDGYTTVSDSEVSYSITLVEATCDPTPTAGPNTPVPTVGPGTPIPTVAPNTPVPTIATTPEPGTPVATTPSEPNTPVTVKSLPQTGVGSTDSPSWILLIGAMAIVAILGGIMSRHKLRN